MKRTLLSLCIIVFLAMGLQAEPEANQPNGNGEDVQNIKTVTPEQYQVIEKAICPSMVEVAYTFQYDKGETGRGCAQYIRQERPLVVAGLMIGNDEIITKDPNIHPRFIKSIDIRAGKSTIPAKISAYAQGQFSVLLKAEKAVPNAKPMTFDAKLEKPYVVSRFQNINTRWVTRLSMFGGSVSIQQKSNFAYRPAGAFLLITDREARGVGMIMNGVAPLDGAWKGSPKDWGWISAEEWDKQKAALKTTSDKGIFRVTLHFRSPKKRVGVEPGRRFRDSSNEISEKQAFGLLISKDKMLILAEMPPKLTGRLNRIEVHGQTDDQDEFEAEFVATLKDYGAFLAKPKDADAFPAKPIVLSDADVLKFEDTFLPSIDAKIQGDEVVKYYSPTRLTSFSKGWREQIYPETDGNDNIFVFTQKNALLAFPISRRRPAGERGYMGDAGDPRLTPTVYLKKVLAALDANIAPSNVPLGAADENRLAWLGLELQSLNEDLARMSEVSEETQNGSTGAMVSFVYPNSPAAKAGIEPGDILLRLHLPDKPKPVEVRYQPGIWWGLLGRGPFPWDKINRISLSDFDRIPRPWLPAVDSLTRQLTDLGFGKSFKADFFRDGKVFKKDFKVVQSPTHFDMAKSRKSKLLGMTVQPMTFEVRRAFRKTEKDPGVVVSKVEPGGKADISGIRPFEVITSINDTPINSLEDFKKLTGQGGELRLAMRHPNTGRVVRIDLPKKTPKSQPASAPADETEEKETTSPETPAATQPGK